MLLAAVTGIADASNEDLFLEHQIWRKQNGLPHQSVYSIAEDDKGFMWIGCGRGLVRFDGNIFETVDDESGLPKRTAIFLFFDSQKRLWISFVNGDLWVKENGKFKPFKIPLKDNSRRIVAIGEDANREIWALEEKVGLLHRISDGKTIDLRAIRERKDWSRDQIVTDNSGNTWITFGGNLYRLVNDSVVLEPKWKHHTVMSLAQRSQGGIWIEMSGEIVGFHDGKQTDRYYNEKVMLSRPHHLVEFDSNHLFAGCNVNGAFLMTNGGEIRQFGTEIIGKGSVAFVYKDSNNAIWVSIRNSGLLRIAESRFDHITPSFEMSEFPVRSLSKRSLGGMWVGTAGNGLFSLENGKWTEIDVLSGPLRGHLTSVFEDSNQRVWCGFWGEGIFYLDANGISHSISKNTVVRQYVSSFLETKNGEIWSATSNGLMRFKNGSPIWYDRNCGFPSNVIEMLCEDNSERLWFTIRNQGLAYFKDGEFVYSPIPDIGNDADVHSIVFDDQNRLWISYNLGKLGYLQNETWTQVTTPNRLNAETFLYISSKSGLWLSEYESLFEFRNDSFRKIGSFEKYPKIQFNTAYGNTFFEDENGTMNFAVWGEIIRIKNDPDNLIAHPLRPPIFQSFTVDDQRYSEDDFHQTSTIDIRPSSRDYEFKFTSPYYSITNPLTFRSKMIGYDDDWKNLGTRRILHQGLLPPGKYELQIQAYTTDTESKASSIHFTVLPEWWQKHWVQFLLAAVVVLMIVSITAWLSTYLHRIENLELRRMSAIEKERTRIAQDLHDDIGSSLTRISMLCQRVMGLSDAKAHGYLENIQTANNRILGKMDEIIWAVNPANDDLHKVVQFLEFHAIEFLRNSGVQLELDIEKPFPEFQVTSEVRHNIYLVYKEALSNLIKHSEATRAKIRIHWLNPYLEIEVLDNGIGISAQSINDGVRLKDPGSRGKGLQGMKMRMEDIGSKLHIVSTPASSSVYTTSIQLEIDPIFTSFNKRFGKEKRNQQTV